MVPVISMNLVSRRVNAEPGGPPTLYEHGVIADEAPLVSICIPTFNHGQYVEAAVASALAQTYEPIEVVVVDDGSSDGSYERLLRIRDPRIRLHRNPSRLGHAPNRNRTVALARGELIKFLDDDDVLHADCVARMAESFARDPSVGLVFSRRDLLVEAPEEPESALWIERFSYPHTGFPVLAELNDGRELFQALFDDDLYGNWIGEPSVVMVSRVHFQRAGGFSLHVQQMMDADLWYRILTHAMVGFVDEPLASYRFGHVAATTHNNATGRGWLDHLWTLEQLVEDPEVLATYPGIMGMLEAERRQALRTFLKGGRGAGGRRVPARRYLPYARYRLMSLLGA